MARTIYSISLFVASIALVLALVLAQTADQKGPGQAPDELRFNGNTGDDIRPSPVKPNSQIVDDGEDEDGQQQQQPIRPFDNGFLTPFGNGLFGNSRQDNFRAPFSSLFDNLFGNIHRHADHMSRHIERQFQNLDRLAGEGQDVSYFSRNGVAYVRTCTTKKVSDNDQGQPKSNYLLPFDRSNSQREQQQQQQQKLQQQQQSIDLPEQPQSTQEQQRGQSLEQPQEQPLKQQQQALEQQQPQQPAKPETQQKSS